MKNIYLFIIFLLGGSSIGLAQFSEFEYDTSKNALKFGNESNSIQLGGRVSGYYENRTLKAGNNNLKKNGWAVKDNDLDFLGTTSSHFEYEFHISIIDLATAAATQNSAPTSPGIKAAYLNYVGGSVHIKFGFDKLPFSQGSITDVYKSPFWSHANLNGGDLFSRRDLGLTLNYTMLKNHINIFGGAYTGMGENFYEYGNDASGTFEYIGRVEYCYPRIMKYRIMDDDNSQRPCFRIALNGRYEDKTQPAGQSIGTDAMAPYGLRIVNGKRTVYGGDCIVKYKGFSYLFETDLMRIMPASPTDALFEGTANSWNKGYVNAGGYVTSINYNNNKLRSAISIQYEDFKTNDLIKSEQSWLSFAFAYKVDYFKSVAKLEYYIPTLEATVTNPIKYTAQIRIGYQIVF